MQAVVLHRWATASKGFTINNQLNKSLSEETIRMIEKDIPRVNIFNKDDQSRLRDILKKLTKKLPTYNQGLSFVCAFLITHVKNDEECELIWITCCLPSGFCSCSPPARAFCNNTWNRFDFLFARVLPELNTRFSVLKYETVYFAVDWFTTLFTNSLSSPCCELVWDVMIIDNLEDALFLCGLAILKSLETTFLSDPLLDGDKLMLDFKRIVKENLKEDEFRGHLQWMVQKLVPSTFIPRGSSTILALESKIDDPNDILVQIPFDATFLMRAVQLNDANRIRLEISKYQFPQALIDYALYRAALLGHTLAVDALFTGDAHFNANSDFNPLKVAVILGHAELVRYLLSKMVLKGEDVSFLPLFATEVKLLREQLGETDLWHGALLVVEGKCCIWCASSEHGSSACPSSSHTFIFNTQNPQCCKGCEVNLLGRKRRKFPCSRCQFTYCDRCCDTFRTIKNKAYRACDNCHHFWGSCVCNVAAEVSCDHSSFDLISENTCECGACLKTFVKIRGGRFLNKEAFRKIEQRFLQSLDQIADELRRKQKLLLIGGGTL